MGKSVGLVERWSAKFDWPVRVAAHAAHLAVVERGAIEAAARSKAAEWLQREETLRETEWAMHEKCIAAAKRGLDAYMARDKVYANLADIARMLEVASKLGRLAAGMATERKEVTGEDGGPIKVEFALALKKIYGVAAPPGNYGENEVVDVEALPDKKVAGVGVSTN